MKIIPKTENCEDCGRPAYDPIDFYEGGEVTLLCEECAALRGALDEVWEHEDRREHQVDPLDPNAHLVLGPDDPEPQMSHSDWILRCGRAEDELSEALNRERQITVLLECVLNTIEDNKWDKGFGYPEDIRKQLKKIQKGER